MNDKILRRPDVMSLTGLSKTWLDQLERDGRFPPRRQLSVRAIGWLESEVIAWIQSRPHAHRSWMAPPSKSRPKPNAPGTQIETRGGE